VIAAPTSALFNAGVLQRNQESSFDPLDIGWNEKNDGGVSGKTLFDETQGDWVWQ
jgi:hypothetical protein